jgi:osmoprotectant transport system permease protein
LLALLVEVLLALVERAVTPRPLRRTRIRGRANRRAAAAVGGS